MLEDRFIGALRVKKGISRVRNENKKNKVDMSIQ
jgi:hypothetical protein